MRATVAIRALTDLWAAAPATLIGHAALVTIGGLVPVAGAGFLAGLLDAAASGGSVVPFAAGLGVVGVVGASASPVNRYLRAEIVRRAALRAKSRLVRAVNGLDELDRLEDPAFLDRLRVADQAGAGMPLVLVQAFGGVVQSTVTAVGLTVALASVSPWLVLAGWVVCAPAAVAAAVESGDRARLIWQTSAGMRRHAFFGGLVTDARAGQEIRVFGLGATVHDRMMAELSHIGTAQRRVERSVARTQGMLAVLGGVLVAAGGLWVAAQASRGDVTVGQLSLALTGLGGLHVATTGLVRAFGDIHHGLGVYAEYDTVLALSPPTPPRRAHGPSLRPLRAGIEIDAVSFGYRPGDPPALRQVSFTIPAGATVALVGANGAGKSTLVKLLCRLYRPTSGAIRWDGVDIATVAADDVRGRIGVLFQDFMAYDLSAADNVGFGDLTRADDLVALRRAATEADVDDVLAHLPDGYDTMLSRAFAGVAGADGRQLSGGQWQRVALARALMRRDADLTILDEPGAGLDPDAEARLYPRLRSSPRRGALLLITHRLAAARQADLIVVLADGTVVERGTHDELVSRRDGHYARMFGVQAAPYDLHDDGRAHVAS